MCFSQNKVDGKNQLLKVNLQPPHIVPVLCPPSISPLSLPSFKWQLLLPALRKHHPSLLAQSCLERSCKWNHTLYDILCLLSPIQCFNILSLFTPMYYFIYCYYSGLTAHPIMTRWAYAILAIMSGTVKKHTQVINYLPTVQFCWVHIPVSTTARLSKEMSFWGGGH